MIDPLKTIAMINPIVQKMTPYNTERYMNNFDSELIYFKEDKITKNKYKSAKMLK